MKIKQALCSIITALCFTLPSTPAANPINPDGFFEPNLDGYRLISTNYRDFDDDEEIETKVNIYHNREEDEIRTYTTNNIVWAYGLLPNSSEPWLMIQDANCFVENPTGRRFVHHPRFEENLYGRRFETIMEFTFEPELPECYR